MKKTCSILACLAIIIGCATTIASQSVWASAAVETPTVIYTEDFSTAGELPAGWSNLTPANGTATVSDGRLKMLSTVDAAGNAAKNLMLKLPEKAGGLKNFTYEIKFTIKRSTDAENGRYMGFMFRMTGEDAAKPQYWHMAVRRKPSVASGVEFGSHGAYNTDKWNIVGRALYDEADLGTDGCLNPDILYTAKIDVKGKNVSTYLNGIRMTSAEMDTDSGIGGMGLQICNLEAEVDSIVVTEMPVSANINTFATEYAYATNLISPPVVATIISSGEQFNQIKTNISVERPQIAIFKVNDSGIAVDGTGAEIAPLETAVLSLVPKPTRTNPNPSMSVIPAFYAINEAAANKIATFCLEKGICDAFVISKDYKIVKSMREKLVGLRGILDCSDYDISTEAGLKKVRDETNISNSRVAILPKTATRDQIDYLQSRLITVWTAQTANTVEMATCVSRGSTGILTDDYSAAYKLLKSFSIPSRAAMPYIAAHRGNTYGEPNAASTTNPANSLEAAKDAYKLGADTIESDIYVTVDNRLVIGHDPTLGAYGEMFDNGDKPSTPVTGNPALESMTLNEIKTKFFLRGGKCRIPTLDEYFEEFKKDKSTIHFVEIKSYKANAVSLLKALADKYDVTDQLVVIIFKDHVTQLKQLREIMPEISVGYLTQDNVWNDVVDSVSTIVGQTAPFNATYNPHYKMLDKSKAAALLRRGITTWEWTSEENQFAEHFNNGYSGITTNHSYQAADLITRVTAPANLNVGGNAETATDAKVTLTANTVLDAPIQNASVFLVVEGASKLTLENGKMFGTAVSATDNKVVVLLGYTYQNTKTKLTYTLFSEPVTVTIAVEKPIDPIDPADPSNPNVPIEPTQPKKGCKSDVSGSVAGLGFAILTVAGLLLIVIRNKKTNIII